MERTSALRIAILGFLFLGIIFTITAIAGNEWEMVEGKITRVTVKVTVGLWKECTEVNGGKSQCSTFKYDKYPKDMKQKLDATKAFMIIAAIMYGLAFILLAAAQFTKKEMFAKAIAPVFFFIMTCGIIAMSCYTSYFEEQNDKIDCKDKCPSFGWTYGIGWASVGLALVGTVLSAIGVLMAHGKS